ncbi:hypothetical protein OF83DRAFT_1170214 [Amylostereum chailletii]|nr:hypothetical protein OF83DRAFT_1170214 [Amylostereum chailletii]
MTSVGEPLDDGRDRLFDDEQSAFTAPSQAGMAFDTDPFAFLSSFHPSTSASSSSASSTQDDSSQAPSPPDWSEFSNLWDPLPAQHGLDLDLDAVMPSDNSKQQPPMHDFSFAPMDLDFDPSALGIDPSSLHFDPNKLFTTPSFFAPAFPIDHNANKGIEANLLSIGPGSRRLSVTSSSSSSGSSLSSVAQEKPSFSEPSTMAPNLSNLQMQMLNMAGNFTTTPGTATQLANDPASELAQRVRQAAGVTLAVPMQAQQNPVPQKLPIPRLPRPTPPPITMKSTQQSSPPSLASSPPSSTPSPSPSSAPSVSSFTPAAPPAPVVPTAPGARPKTSHTTIERRYRTNLNARIQSLKDAVPALRVLERKKAGAKAAKVGEEAVKEEAAKENAWGDVVDERGYVDGVKVARKVSKANVLGKAAEYIRVLKRREARLKREQDGLRSLIGGLIGGPALLREWEAAWTARFGGPECDELDYEAAGEEDDEDDDEDDEEDDSRARKRAKVIKEPTAKEKKDKKASGSVAAASSSNVPEKRKRGRPRKIAPSITPTSVESQTPDSFSPAQTTPPPPVVPQSQPATQYLLAAFAFFSFFKSPLTSYSYPSTPSSHAHAHTGSVMSSTPVSSVTGGSGWHELVDLFHIIVSALVFLSIVLPWLPSSLRLTRIYLPSTFPTSLTLRRPSKSKIASSSAPKVTTTKSSDTFNRVALLDALAPDARGTPDEAAQLRSALGIYPGLAGLVLRVVGKVLRGARATRGIERLQLEQRAWVRLGEVVALDGKIPFGARVQAYLGMLSHTSSFSACATDLATLALIVHPLSSTKADALWARAARARLVRPFEQRVLDGMTVAQAAAKLADLRNSTLLPTSPTPSSSSAWNNFSSMSPLVVLGVLSVREDVRAHAGKLFVRTVAGADAEIRPEREVQREEEARAACVAAGRSLGGRTAELVTSLERVAQGDEALSLSGAECAEEALLSALVLFRRLFPSSLSVSPAGVRVLLSPPPSPSKRNAEMRGVLRRALGSEVFEVRRKGACDHETEREGEDDEERRESAPGREVEVEAWEVALEDARDRVVDLLVEADRVERRGRM